MSQVIIVSNRLPVSVKRENGKLTFSPSIGGLATGLSSYIEDRKNRWIGWPGIASDDLSERDKRKIIARLARHNCVPVFLTQKQIEDFYNGYSNSLLWPLFHDLPFRDSNQARHRQWWQAYRRVNNSFAEAVINIAGSNDRIWVHDYQLLLVPDMLRNQLPRTNIGFFLHIPFPGPKTLPRLNEYKKLLRGVLGADLVGFHTSGYVNAFLENCAAARVGTVGEHQILLNDRVTRVAEFPMGIDYEKYASANKSRVVKAAIRRFKRRYRGLKVIAAVDRLDPSKGLVERLQAYRELLKREPKLRGKVIFSMIAAPSRTDIPAYQKLARRLDELVAEINKAYGRRGWQPVDYMNSAQPFEEVTALFAVADVAFIAPLRDGMNLAAKEFVASKRKHGMLILSETAGAAEELQDALIVNPLRPESLVNALQQALTMPKRELRSRLKNMQRYLAGHTVQNWAKTFVDTLQKPVPGTRPITRTLKGKLEQALLKDYRQAEKRLLLLDYDGSLVPFRENYGDAKPPQKLLNLLQSLSAQNDVVLISGRQATDLKPWFKSLNIHLVAEHGALIKKADSKSWQTLVRGETKWKREVQPILEKYAALTPGARVEVKPHSLVWHYRASPPYYAQKYAVTIRRVLRPIIKTYGVQIFQGNKILEVKDPRINKGAAAERWLKGNYDFILAIGDDFTDEELFQVLPFEAYSIKIGRGRSYARFRLSGSPEAQKLLKKLTK
jgi:trehalose 6-phosphate synthase/phosphatase